jgi:integrase
LAPHIERFLTHKRALGRRFDSEEMTLRLFDRYLVDCGVRTPRDVTSGVVDAFLASRPRPRPRSYNQLLGVLGRLCHWLVTRGVLDRSPVQARPRRGSSARTPVILGPEHVERLLLLAGQLSDKYGGELRGPTFRTIFAVLYALGLRVGEVCRLRVDDVDWERRVLVIRESKFGKSRLVPFGPRLGQSLASYLDARRACGPPLAPAAYVFSVGRGHPLRRQAIGRILRRFRSQLGLVLPAGASPLRVHDLRHSFATRALLRWYRTGVDPAQRLLLLSTFMGHVQPESTAVYLTITAELLEIAGTRFERLATALLPEAPPC